MEHPFDELDGVKETVSGYTGGQERNPTYQEVSSGKTGHAEAVQIIYDPEKITYEELLNVFWRNINPTTLNRQFSDVGTQYRTAIYYHNDQQERLAIQSKDKLERSGRFQKPIVTEITPASEFYRAEEYHQDYYKKKPSHYKMYRFYSGRDQYINKVWGK